MNNVYLDIRFLSHLLDCIVILRDPNLGNLNKRELAEDLAIIDMTIEQLKGIIDESKVQAGEA